MANVDISPPAGLAGRFPEIAPLIENQLITERFAGFERAATSSKALYNWVGAFSLVAAGIATTVLILSLTIGPRGLLTGPFGVALAITGVFGVVTQILLASGFLKRRWLLARFAAERARSIKFEAFRAVGGADAAELQARVRDFTEARLAQLELQLANGRGAYREFDPQSWLDKIPPDLVITPERFKQLAEIYRDMRLAYQIGHAAAYVDHHDDARRLPMALSEVAFLCGAVLACFDLALTLDVNGWRPLAAFTGGAEIRDFLTLGFFVLSALLFVYQRARGDHEAVERYQDYRTELARVEGQLIAAETPGEFVACVRQGELVALSELKSFMRAADRSTYVF